MEICSFNHEEIVYAEGSCPLCNARIDYDITVEAYKDEILVLEDTIKGLKQTIAERWEADR